MKVLLLSCSTGEGHNHAALAVREALSARGHETQFLDEAKLVGEAGPLSFENALNVISTRVPAAFGAMYHAGEMYSATKLTSPVYLANMRHADRLGSFIAQNGYDAVVCSHLFPMETLTCLRRRERLAVRCYGVLTDYTCIPFFEETELDGYFLPHRDVRESCLRAGMPGKKLHATGMPVSGAFRTRTERKAARAALSLPQDRKLYLIMTGGIGCGDAVTLCDAVIRDNTPDILLCVLAGRNGELRDRLEEKYAGDSRVLAVPFTDQVPLYMAAADVLLSKAGGISSSEAAVLNVPLVHTMAIPGVETINAGFFRDHGMSFFADGPASAARLADRLIYDRAAARRMLSAQRAGVRPDGAARIAALIEKEQPGNKGKEAAE